ncbi:tetrahydromethanopterin S-methyltransferase subunit G [Rhizobium azooxidifex]|uniref:Tetrahydromethanopterin S-methyltransferase subunit G n=1 Tax=Mycoplana azooxidifex TaxID=1636188 RepID=A0A7W6GNK5_9HYPH|nr:tetrahydromethanopterin S-methyltransferase subunit G [Mycoplana azooxidifex]
MADGDPRDLGWLYALIVGGLLLALASMAGHVWQVLG